MTVVDRAAFPANASFPVTLTATVTGAGPTSPTGTVSFTYGTTSLGSAPIANGQATLTTTALPAGSDQVTATYSGDATYAGSTASHTQVVTAIATVTSLGWSSTSSADGEPVTFTASISHSIGSAPVTGTVTFTDGTAVLGTSPVVNGKATFTTSTLAAGHHDITARYTGDSVYATSSDSHPHVVRPATKPR